MKWKMIKIEEKWGTSIDEIEEKHKAKYIDGVYDGKKFIVTLMPVASLDFYIDIQNFTTRLYVKQKDKKYNVLPYEKIKDKKLFGELVRQVVYRDHKTGLSMSGQYYPLSRKSVELFKQMMQEGEHD